MLIQDSESLSMRKPSSYSIETYMDTDGNVREVEYIACKHCRFHFPRKPGSGVWQQRGWCQKCNGYLCGSPVCMKYCIPYEARIDFEDGGNGMPPPAKYVELIRQLIIEGALFI